MTFDLPTADDPVRLICGDALDILRQLPAGCVDAVVTDPPFNVSKPDAIRGKMRGAGRNAGTFDFGEWDVDFNPSEICQEWKRVLERNGQCYVFTSSTLLPEWIGALRDSFDWKVLTWCKPDPLPSLRQRHWVSASEHVLWFWRGRYTLNWLGHGEMYSWQVLQAPKQERFHLCQKPLDLVKKYILASTNPGDVVLDCYLGSGTTGVACVQTGRRFIGVEIDPGYFQIAQRRINDALGVGGLFDPKRPEAADLYAETA